MRPTSAWILGSALLATPATALTYFERLILQELSCGSPPDPTLIVRELADAGMINLADNIGFDSLSCYQIKGELGVRGVALTSICVDEEDPVIQSWNEDIYYRAPGTSPGQTLAFGTPLDADKLSDWYLDQFGPAHVASAIADSEMTLLGSESEVGCRGYMP